MPCQCCPRYRSWRSTYRHTGSGTRYRKGRSSRRPHPDVGAAHIQIGHVEPNRFRTTQLIESLLHDTLGVPGRGATAIRARPTTSRARSHVGRRACRVGSEYQRQLVAAVELGEGVGGKRGSGPGHLALIDLEAGCLLDSKTGHRCSMGGGGDLTTRLLPGVPGRHEPHVVKLELLARRGSRNQMAEVNRVESATENPPPHASSLGPRPPSPLRCTL